jgi:hypothetical protein
MCCPKTLPRRNRLCSVRPTDLRTEFQQNADMLHLLNKAAGRFIDCVLACASSFALTQSIVLDDAFHTSEQPSF